MAASREEGCIMPKYSLVRQDGSAGDSGPLCEIIDGESWTVIPGETYPKLGCGVRVGSIYARSYSGQDYWQTTPITEITDEWIDDDGYKHMRFKTKNSTYIWKEF